jgi:2,5-dioxopentanoate dehydrogenase
MELQPQLIDGQWQVDADPAGTLQAVAPATGETLPEQYPVASWATVERALDAAVAAQQALQARPDAAEVLGAFLEAMAAELERRAEALVALAHTETALPAEPRLRSVELPRTINQLRLAAAQARSEEWRAPVIDTKAKIRSQLEALTGPVVTFGPNNFPFAFNGIAGGDFAAAIAAGHPVLAKANPGHPGTTRLLTEAAAAALEAAGLPLAMVQMIYHLAPADGLRLVADPRVAAAAFTGSRAGGLALKAAADAAGKPIYLELSSVNPVFILPGALRERLEPLAAEFTASCLSGAGQFCTNPGLVLLLAGPPTDAWIETVKAKFAAAAPGTLLGSRGPGQVSAALRVLAKHGAQLLLGGTPAAGTRCGFDNTLLRISAQDFLKNAQALQTEAFGPTSLLVTAASPDELLAIAGEVEGSLTGCIYSDSAGADDALAADIARALRPRVGRLLNDKMPTGVAVSPAMNHGGPYPSTGHPGFTSVGLPAAMRRFAALRCYDNVREPRLPPTLRDRNPSGRLWRYVDGVWTQGDVPDAPGP